MTPAVMLGIGLCIGAIARMSASICQERRKIREFEAKLAETRVTPEKP